MRRASRGRRGLRATWASLLLVLGACSYDPNAQLYTMTEPDPAEVAGRYVFDQESLPPDARGVYRESFVELRADGTFTAHELPMKTLLLCGAFEVDQMRQRASGTGTWRVGGVGFVQPGNRQTFGVGLITDEPKLGPFRLTGDAPPYGAIFTFGDPDMGYCVRFGREE